MYINQSYEAFITDAIPTFETPTKRKCYPLNRSLVFCLLAKENNGFFVAHRKSYRPLGSNSPKIDSQNFHGNFGM